MNFEKAEAPRKGDDYDVERIQRETTAKEGISEIDEAMMNVARMVKARRNVVCGISDAQRKPTSSVLVGACFVLCNCAFAVSHDTVGLHSVIRVLC